MRKVAFLLALLIGPICAYAQNTGTGIPPFSSLTSSSLDTINNQNLNAYFAIPIMSSAGRGIPLSVALAYNSLIWSPSGGTWKPAVDAGGNANWGWLKDIPKGGYLTYAKLTTATKCGLNWGTQTRYYNYAYIDALGTSHPVPAISIVYFCGTDWSGTFSGYASDDTGFFVDTNEANPNPNGVVTGPGGQQVVKGISTAVDVNGNYVTKTVVNSTETDWTDSVGNKALKILYTPISSNPTQIQYQFLDGSGTDSYQTITLKLTAQNVKTNFACANVTEYSGSVNLPSELDIPSPVSGTLKYTFTYEATPGLTGYSSGRVQRVTLPTGGYYEYDYPGVNDSVNCSDGTTLKMNRVVSDGTNSATWNFVRNTANSTMTLTTPKLADTPNANDTVYTFNTLGHETSRKIYANSPGSSLWRTVSTTWASNGTPATQVIILEDNSTKAETDTTYDSNGLLDQVGEYDWGTGAHGSASWIRSTYYSYLGGTNYTSRNILNLLTVKYIQDASATIQYKQYTQYDGTTITNCPPGVPQHDDTDYPCSMNYRGNPTTVTTYTSPSVPSGGITKNFTYDVFGNLLTAQLNCCQSKTWNYSGATQYSQPDSVTSGTSPTLTTSYLYNLYLGLVTKATDPNNLIANYSYDFLRRPTLAAIVGGSSTSTSYDDVNFKTTSTTTIDSSKSVQQISAADTLGRTLTTTLEDGTGSVKSVVKNEYDLAGRAYGVSNPYTTGNPVYSTTSFDVLGRVTSVTAPAPDSSITGYTYSTNTITVKDPTGKQRQSVFDAAGRLSAVYEPDATTGLLTVPTLYKYTVLDQLATVASAPSNPDQTRTYNYDGLGRLTATVTPEGGTTCFGTKTGSTCNTDGYSPFDQLLTRTDARGVVTSYGYDGLNRLNSVSYNVGSTGVPATSTISLTYGLDSSCTSAHGSGCIGQIITMTDGPGSENYTYNSLEQLTQLQKVIGSTTYTTQYAYNLAGELTTITYPSGRSIAQNLDTIGRLSSIVGTLNSVQTTYASGYGYSPASQLTGFQYGNGIYASLGFTSDRLQLNCVDYSTTNRNGTCTHDSSTKFGLDYSYGAAGSNNGQIQGITDRVDNGRSATYAYDGLARLYTAATTGSASYPAWGLKETYDRYGNRWSQTAISGCTGQTCPQPSVSFNLASNHINTSGYGYDTNGNLTNDGQNTLVYDAENHATSSSGSLGSGTYTYDGNGLRVKKVSGSTTTVYIFSGSKVIAEYDNGAAVGSPSREYISGGSALLAKIDSTGTKYYHQDHLSNRLVTDSSGNKLAEIGHFPFGESWYNATSDKLQFTTYERDAESGNDYAQARYYVSRLGRFSSLDPLPGSTGNPQTLNHYVYALNDPVNGVDPSGLLLVYLSWLLGDGSLQSGFFDSVDLQNAGFDIQFDSNGNIANITAPDFNVAVLNGNGDQVGVIGPDTDLTAGTVQLQQSVTVYASVDSPATISSPVSGQFVELPAVDAGPMAPSAKRMLRAIAAASPTVCGGGFFIYAGYQGAKEFGRVEGEGFVGYLGEWDSNSGWSNNGLVEGGFVNPATGRGVAVGGSGNTTSGPEWLLFVPASPGGGGVMGPSSIGAYVGTPKNGPGVGVGGYVNIMPSATCSAVRAQNSNRGTGGGGGF